MFNGAFFFWRIDMKVIIKKVEQTETQYIPTMAGRNTIEHSSDEAFELSEDEYNTYIQLQQTIKIWNNRFKSLYQRHLPLSDNNKELS